MEFFDTIRELTDISTDLMNKMIGSVIIIILLWVIRLITVKIIWRSTQEVRIRYQWRRTSTYALFFLFLILMGAVWIEEFRAIGTFLGLLYGFIVF